MTRKAVLLLWLIILADVAVNYASDALLRERRSGPRIRVVELPVQETLEVPSTSVAPPAGATAIDRREAWVGRLIEGAHVQLARMDYGHCLWCCDSALSIDPGNDEVLDLYAQVIEGLGRQLEERSTEIYQHLSRPFPSVPLVSWSGRVGGLEDALANLSALTGLAIEVDPALSNRPGLREAMDLAFTAISPTDALQQVCDLYGVTWSVDSVNLDLMTIGVHERFYDVDARSPQEMDDPNEPFKGVIEGEMEPYIIDSEVDLHPYFGSGSSSTAPSPESTSSTR